MPARTLAALSSLLAPLAALAQQAGGQADNGTPTRAGYAWLWIIAGVAVLVALFRLFFSGRGEGPEPPARHP